MAAEFSLVARNYSELVDALARIKNLLGLSNETLEQVAGLCAGHADKLLGPTRVKRIGPRSLDLLLGALAIELHVKPDPAAVERISHRWQRRNEAQVRTPTRLSKEILERAKPIILSELARKGWQTRQRQGRRNGHSGNRAHNANGHAAER